MIFDRSWYNRAGVERVMGFCRQGQVREFLEDGAAGREGDVDSGIILIKYWLEVSHEEQTRRLEERIDDPRKIWKLSPMDLKSYSRWYDYSRARDDMFTATDTDFAPWYVVRTDDKRRAPSQHHHASAQADSLQEAATGEDKAARNGRSGAVTASRSIRSSSSMRCTEQRPPPGASLARVELAVP